MSFYDNYFSSKGRMEKTKIGALMEIKQINWFINLIKNNIKKENFSLLEIGPGKGKFASIFSGNKKHKYFGLEVNIIAAKKLRKKGFNVITGSYPKFTIKNEKFDVIYSNQVFEHMKNRDEATSYIISSKKMLKKGGLIVISSPEINFWGVTFFAGDYTHSFPTSIHSVKQILMDNDLDIIYSNFYTMFFIGYFFSKLITVLYKIIDFLGITDLIFGIDRSFKIKTVISPSFIIIASYKNEK